MLACFQGDYGKDTGAYIMIMCIATVPRNSSLIVQLKGGNFVFVLVLSARFRSTYNSLFFMYLSYNE